MSMQLRVVHTTGFAYDGKAVASYNQARLTPQSAHEAMTTGRRYGGQDALAAGIVDRAVDEESLRRTAVEIAQSLAVKAGPTMGTIKTRMYGPVLEALARNDASL